MVTSCTESVEADAAKAGDANVTVGAVTAVSGLRGEIRLRSFTRPDTEILSFGPWFLAPSGASSPGSNVARSGWIRPQWVEQETRGPYRVIDGGKQGKQIIARLEGIDDREAARKLVGLAIQVAVESLPPPAPGEYYWDQLIGLRVLNLQDEELGVVDHLLETGANDVVVVKLSGRGGQVDGGGEETSGAEKARSTRRLLPWIESVVIEVNLDAGTMKVDWALDD